MTEPTSEPSTERGVTRLAAELTWTGRHFERNVELSIDATGKILACGPAPPSRPSDGATADGTAAGKDPAPQRYEMPRRAILPGFVNAHSHAFQRGLRGRGEAFPDGAGSFWSWREAMYGLVAEVDEVQVHALSLRAFREMLLAGITSVGEFHYLHHAADGSSGPGGTERQYAMDEAVLAAAKEAGIRIVLLQTCYQAGGFGQSLGPAQQRFATTDLERFWEQVEHLGATCDPATQSVGVAAHSVRAVPPAMLERLAAGTRSRGLVLHLHLEEQPQEIEDCRRATGLSPMGLVMERVQPGPDTTAVHCTHSDNAELRNYLETGARVCICPLTEANLGDGLADLPTLLPFPGQLSLGTDSNARIAMSEEARWLEYGQRLAHQRRGVVCDSQGHLGPRLLEIATVGGASSLGLEAGSFQPGNWADAAIIDLDHPSLDGCTDDSLLDAFLLGAHDGAVAGALVGGRSFDR